MKDRQLPLPSLEWDVLGAKQKEAITARVRALEQEHQKMVERIEFVKTLVKRFDQTALNDNTAAEQLAQLPIFHEVSGQDPDFYIPVFLERRSYLKQIARALARVIAQGENPALNKDDLRALAARLLIEAKLTLRSVPGPPKLVAQETAKLWIFPLVLGYLLQLEPLSGVPALHLTGAGLMVISISAFTWNISARDTGKLKPRLHWPKAFDRAAEKVRGRLSESFWTDVQIGLMLESIEKWNRGKISTPEFERTILNWVEGAKSDLNQVDCRAILAP